MSTPAEAARTVGDADTTTVSDAFLIERARKGDRAAFGRLYDRHAATTYRYALSIVRKTNDAEDVVQDVFLTTWTRIKDVAVVDASALPWLLTTVRFKALNLVRSTTRDRNRAVDTNLAGHPDSRIPPNEALQLSLLASAIDEAVSGLSEIDQTLFYLCIEQGCSYADAAIALGFSHGSVRNRLSRLRTVLRAALRPYEKGLS